MQTSTRHFDQSPRHHQCAFPLVKPPAPSQRSSAQMADYRVIRRNGAVVAFEPSQDLGRDDQGLPRHRTAGRVLHRRASVI